MIEPLTKMTVGAHGGSEQYVYEGEAIMSEEQKDRFQALIGDGQAKVTVGRDLSEKDYGNGGGVIVNVTLTCNQSERSIHAAVGLAHEIANTYVWHYRNLLKQHLAQAGIIKG